MKKVAITGASGFLGRWLLKKLLSENMQVHALVRKPESLKSFQSPNLRIFEGDIGVPSTIHACLKDTEAVFHLAGYIGYKYSERKLMEQINIKGTKNVIEAMVSAQCPKIVHMSSVVTVGASFTPQVLNEDFQYNLKPYNFGYPETKRQAEELVQFATRKQQIRSVILNPSTVYGPGDATKGSRSVQVKVAKGKFPFYTSGGVSVSDVENVVDAAFNALSLGNNGERYILAGDNITIYQLFSAISEAAGVPTPNKKLPNTFVKALGFVGDKLEKLNLKGPVNSESAYMSTMYHWFDSSKAARDLGYKHTPYKVSIGRSVKWMKENGVI